MVEAALVDLAFGGLLVWVGTEIHGLKPILRTLIEEIKKLNPSS